jgi:hypothetical protein
MIPATHAPDGAAEQPILWLGMTGFAPQQRAVLEASLTRAPSSPRWRVSAFGDSDAWWVNGAKVRVMPDGNLKVAAGLPTERALNLNLGDVDRPVAFAAPLASADFEPRYVFDPVSEPSIHAVLMQFESWLWLVRAQFVLGAQIIRHGPELRHGIYHVSHRGKLLAVLDFQNAKAAISPRVHPVSLWEARWDKRPAGAGGLPESFVHLTPSQLAWTYVGRTDRDVLPEHYRTQTIYYRHVPHVPLRWLRDSQLMLLRELSAEPGTLDALSRRTGLPASHTEHDLACLYYAGSITTTRAKAAVPAVSGRDSEPHSTGPELDSLSSNGAVAGNQFGSTAPVLLDHKRMPRPANPAGGF